MARTAHGATILKPTKAPKRSVPRGQVSPYPKVVEPEGAKRHEAHGAMLADRDQTSVAQMGKQPGGCPAHEKRDT
jgi:hypothetical protein